MNSLVFKKCTKCDEEKPLSGFHKQRAGKHGVRSICKPCALTEQRGWVENNRDAYRKRLKKADLKRKYGLSIAEFDGLWEDQNGRCLICDGSLSLEQHGHAIDHCHTTGQVRGLLCHHCNFGLGKFKDDPKRLRKAAAYLEAYQRDDNEQSGF